MSKEKIILTIKEVVENLIKDTELNLFDVEYVKEKDWCLRVYLDKKEGIGLEDCQFVSEGLNAFLEESDLIKDQYLLEISSPGLDRALKTEKDFEYYKGSLVEVHFFKKINGEKQIVAKFLEKNENGEIVLMLDDKDVIVNLKDIALIKLYVNF